MSMLALISALRGAGRQQLSAGTIVTTTQATGSYLLRIDGCTLKTAANGTLVKSGIFGVGGHDWHIQCYPSGNTACRGWLSLYLEHTSHSKTGDATACVRMSILDHAGKPWRTKGNTAAEADKYSSSKHNRVWGNFVETKDLDKEKQFKDDDVSILCDVAILDLHTTDYHAGLTSTSTGTVVPPSEMHQQLVEVLWESKEGADMQIEVGGETFAAHRWMLAARSPTFKAELALNTATMRLHVDGMDAAVFKAMLHFIYTDAQPKEVELATMAKPLLMAADMYKLERLKLICEEELCGHIGVHSVASMLTLAPLPEWQAMPTAHSLRHRPMPTATVGIGPSASFSSAYPGPAVGIEAYADGFRTAVGIDSPSANFYA